MKDGDRLSFSASYVKDAASGSATKSSVVFTDENGNPAPFDISLEVEDSYNAGVQTKGTPISSEADFIRDVKEFKAWGWYGNTAWTGVEGCKVVQYGGGMDYRPVNGEGEEINAYNPSNTNTANYKFYAIYPHDLSGTGAKVTTSNSNGLTISYTSPDNGDEDAVAQKEVLAGYMRSTTSMSKVPITFQPILSAIRFKVSKEQLGRDVTIKSIELHTLSATGTCTVSNTGVAWSNHGTQNVTFVQTYDFDIDHNDHSGPDINDNDLTKTVCIIPQTGSTNLSDGTRIVINYTEDGDSTPKSARHLLYGQKFEAGKTYIYNIGNFEGDAHGMEPWVEFSEFTVDDNRLLGNKNEIHEENNSKFIFNFAQQTGVSEKAYFHIYNLVPGRWYSIEFTEKQTLYNRDGNNNATTPNTTNTTFAAAGCYACSVSTVAEQNTATNAASQLIYDRFLQQGTFIWEHPDDITGSTAYNSLKDQGKTAKITFKATESTMLWTWDFSSGRDGNVLRAEIYLVGDKIKDITPEDGVPTIDFQNSTLYNFAKNSAWDSYSSMKTYAVDATAGAKPVSGELSFRVVNPNTAAGRGNLGRLNIPLKNLDTDKTYKLTYTVNKEVGTKRTGQNFGFVIQESPITNNTAFNGVTGYKSYNGSTYDADTFNIVNEEYTFKPTATEMFWVWDFSNFGVGENAHQFVTFSDVTIKEVTTP